MSVATLLTQPKFVEKLKNQAGEETLGEDLVALIRQIVTNTDQSQAVLEAIQAGFEAFGENFVDNATDFDAGLRQLNTLLTPVINQIRSFGESNLDDFSSVATFIAEKFVALTDVAADLNINSVRQVVSEILTILTSKFGFSLENIVAQVWVMFDSVIAELKNLPNDIDTQERELHQERELRLVTASLLNKIKRQLQDEVVLPDLNSDQISTAIMEALRDLGLDDWIQYANNIAEALQATFLAAGSIGELIEALSGVGGSVGAAARQAESGDTYCWYASWLLATRKRSFWETIGNVFILNPSDEVWISADKTQVVWRTVFGDDVCLHEGTDVQWQQAPIFNGEGFSTGSSSEYVLFPHIGHDTLEGLTQATYVIVEFSKTIWNTVDAVEPGDHASAVTHLIWNTFNAVFGGVAGKPFNSYLTAVAGWGQGHQGWISAIYPILGTLIPSIEGRHTEADEDAAAFWAILLADDVLERAGHHLLLSTVRDLLLSTLTLINNIGQPQGNDSSHPINKEYTSTWAAVGGTVATIIFFKTAYKKEDYKYPFNGFLWSFAGALAGLCGGLTGTLIGAALAGFNFSLKSFFTDIGIETAKGFGLFYLNAYSWAEGDTDGGKFNGGNDEFAGYPAKTDSPYKLPFAKDEVKPCVQGNQGMWSHYTASNQIYAVDFGFDQAEVVVASRSGTVVDFFDQTDNDKKTSWNYIVIRHDDSAETSTVQENHDKYHDGNEYITYGVYGHGRKDGVREIFAARDTAVAVADIVGTQIAQGEPIMKAGNTGNSFHNHLHFQVQTKLEAHGTPRPTGDAIPIGDLEDDTIPFVYRDVSDDGVVESLTFYKSDNGTS